MWKSVMSVIVGYLVIAVLVIVTTTIAGSLTLESFDQITPTYLTANIVLGFISAIAGGFTTAKLAPNNPLRHVQYLAGLVIILGLVSLATPLEGQPSWYPWAIMLTGAVGVLTGGAYSNRQKNSVV